MSLSQRQTLDGVPFTDKQEREYDWCLYQRWAIAPLMTREQYMAQHWTNQ